VATEQRLRWDELFAARTRAGGGEGVIQILALAGAKDVIALAGGIPDPQTFPGPVLAEILGELMEAGDASPLQYAPTEGLPGPRDFVAGRLERLEERRPTDGELLLTSGGIEALELVGKAFVDRSDVVLAEAPTYLGALMAFQSFEAEIVGVPLDDDGLQVDELERLLANGLRPKLLYTIPDYQNPAGVSLAPERRRALVELARRHGFLVVEDVAYRDLAYGDAPPPTLWAQGHDVVVQIGTFSKTFCPGVRLGWAVGPDEVVAKLRWAKQNTDQCTAALGQRLLEEYGRRGLLDEQVAHSRELYRPRRDAMLAGFERELGGRASWTRPDGGFFSWLDLPRGLEAVAFAGQALEAGVAVVPGPPFYIDGGGGHQIRLSFSRATEEEIAEGVRLLAGLLA
jgi:2-aminoadipate transaminase